MNATNQQEDTGGNGSPDRIAAVDVERDSMKQMTVKSPYGVDITVYEVMHENKVYWFTEDALMYAERLYRAANQPRNLDDLNWQFKESDEE